MTKYRLLVLLLAAPLAQAEHSTDSDGYTRPLEHLKINPALDQREFERSTLDALDIYDPWESWNRRVYHFNYRADQWVMLPVVRGYEKVTPRLLRSGVSNFFSNLGEIPNLLNSLLQLKGKRSLHTSARLLLNTTIGVFGLWDPASRVGLMTQREDFGQTLGFYGVPSGPFLMLPLLGPSNLRDGAGLSVDITAGNQVNFLNVPATSSTHPELFALQLIDMRYSIPLRYGQLNSSFEYEKLRYVYDRARTLQIAE